MIALVPIIFQCLRYQGKEKKVGVLLMLIVYFICMYLCVKHSKF